MPVPPSLPAYSTKQALVEDRCRVTEPLLGMILGMIPIRGLCRQFACAEPRAAHRLHDRGPHRPHTRGQHDAKRSEHVGRWNM
jgi:hypothetical protein